MEKKLGRNDPCWCGSGKKYKKCHCDFDEIIEEHRILGEIVPPRELIKNKEQIQGIKDSGVINTAVLDYVAENIKAGCTTEDIDKWVYEKTVELGAVPAPLNYEGFPKSVCTSIDEVVCHGIPSSDVVLKDGDIINVDISTIYKGYFSDASRMFCIGEVSEEKKKLVEITCKSVELGLTQVKPWGHLGDIAQVIKDLAHENGYTVVREIGGHGIGLEFHEDPWVSYVSKPENFKIPIVGRYMHRCLHLPIDRDNPRNALVTINEAADQIARGAVSMGIFPEGTRSKTGELGEFKNGAFKIAQKAKCPIVVAAIKGMDRAKHRLFLPTTVTLNILGVLPYSETAEMRTAEISEKVRSMILTA